MSMSTLGQQLAAINAAAGNKNVGSTLATSRRHADAIGRGLTHSVQVGHAVHKTLFKPSIIYEDARKASDVPLATIRENCVASLRQLEDLDAEFGIYVKSLCKPSIQERGLLTTAENDVIDKTIEDLIFRLSLRMTISGSNKNNNNNSNGTLSSCLHVVEYLLRKFDIHLRPKTASTTLLVMLPHHEQPFFLRLLQLMDLANMPEWTFLRPYAVPGAKVGRSIVAQQASRDVALVRSLGRLSQRNAKLPCCETSLSFTAAVLVEALTLQTQRRGTIEERTCQALLPFVVAACRNISNKGGNSSAATTRHVWQNWGFVLASTMVETSVLEIEPRNLLVSNILDGLVRQKQVLDAFNDSQTTAVSKAQSSHDFMQLLSNGMTVALTVLLQGQDNSVVFPPTDVDGSIPMVDCQLSIRTGNDDSPTIQYGFPMNKELLRSLLALNSPRSDDEPSCNSSNIVAECLGRLYRLEGIAEIKHWVASIVVLGWKVISKIGQKEKKARYCRNIQNLIVSLMEHPQHVSGLWKEANGEWIEAFVSFLVGSFPTHILMKPDLDPEKDSVILSCFKTILHSLKNLLPLPFERGLASGLLKIKHKKDRSELAKCLGLVSSSPGSRSISDNLEEEEDEQDSTSNGFSLPPRVALEHADPDIRLKSIPKLVHEANENDEDIVNDDGETIPQALVRRFLMDDNSRVAVASAKALDGILVSVRHTDLESINLGQELVEAYHKWSTVSTVSDTERAEILVWICRLASIAIKQLSLSVDVAQTKIFGRVLEVLGAMMVNDVDPVSIAACTAILSIRKDESSTTSRADQRKRAGELLISEKDILVFFRRNFESRRNASELSSRRKLAQVILDAVASSSIALDEIACEALEYCLWVYETFPVDLSESQRASCMKALASFSEHVSSKPEKLRRVILRLAAGYNPCFKSVAEPFIVATCKAVGKQCETEPLAILMEVVLSTDDRGQLENLLHLAKEMTPGAVAGCMFSVFPALALTSTTDARVRELAIDLVSTCGAIISSQAQPNEEWFSLSVFRNHFKGTRAASMSIGPAFLSQALSSVFSSADNPEMMRDLFLKLIFCFSVSVTLPIPLQSMEFQRGWLQTGQQIGGFRAAITFLKVAEMAGEEHFPLMSQWRLLGKPLLEAFLVSEFSGIYSQHVELLALTVRMLKGVKIIGRQSDVSASRSTIITSGCTPRGRSRSYSFGKNDDISYLRPYPNDMQTLLVRILTAEGESGVLKELKALLCEHVLSSDTWKREVFCHLDKSTRETIALSLIAIVSRSYIQNAEEILLSLPLRSVDIANILSCDMSDEMGLSQVSLASEFVSSNASALVSDGGVECLVSAIFKQLAGVRHQVSDEALHFVRYSLLDSLRHTVLGLEDKETELKKFNKSKSFGSWIEALVEETLTSDLRSIRSAKTALATLATLCKCIPKTVIPHFVTLIAGFASDQYAVDHVGISTLLNLSVPVFFQNAGKAGLSQADLINAFIETSEKRPQASKLSLYRLFALALGRAQIDGFDSSFSPVGSFVAALLVREMLHASRGQPQTEEPQQTQFVVEMLSELDTGLRISAATTMQAFARRALFASLKQEQPKQSRGLPTKENVSGFSLMYIDELGLEGSCRICKTLALASCDLITTSDVQSFVYHSPDIAAKILLRSWQECLLIQTECQKHQDLHGLASMGEVLSQVVDLVQSSLPPHVYLAFVSHLLKEEEREIRCRAVQAIAERSRSLFPESPESLLLIEMVPLLLQTMTKDPERPIDAKTKMLHHYVLVAIDCIGRHCCFSPTDSNTARPHAQTFADVLSVTAETIVAEIRSENRSPFSRMSVESHHLLSSAAICSSTAVKLCGPKTISFLPKLMSPLLEVLVLVCEYHQSSMSDIKINKSAVNQTRLIQLSVLRALSAIVKAIPLLLTQYLVRFLKAVVMIPACIGIDSALTDSTVRLEYQRLEATICTKIPARQLIPAASSAVSSHSGRIQLISLISILKNSVNNARAAEVPSQSQSILNAAFHIFENDTNKEMSELWNASNDLIVALVLKQSEVQFRGLYKRLEVWRSEKQLNRAFWQLSASLCQNLKSIFLPSLTTVFQDAVQELESATLLLCKNESKKSADGRKKQRISLGSETDKVQLYSLKALLQFLEVSLHVDAQNGGTWVREMEGQRYEALLQPLGKLLQCWLPCDGTRTSFTSVVQGLDSEPGSVVACIVALASAAGDEQLWKPLNHLILQACSNDKRNEVRKAAVTCLVSLVKSIGEEYMVLIPECLPTLAELLEDSDEEIAILARDCIAQSEDLLGESLQDSLL